MQFCDFDNDLNTFNSLMEDIEASSDQQPDDDDDVDSGEIPSAETPINGQEIANAIISAISAKDDTAKDMRNKLFRSTYYPQTYSEPFAIGSIDQKTIQNDSQQSDGFDSSDDKIIRVNFSAMVRKHTEPSYVDQLKQIGSDWSKATSETFNGFYEAIKKAVEDLNKTDNDSDDQQESMNTDDVQTPDDNDVDEHTLLSTIMDDFNKNYKQQLEIDCNSYKNDSDDVTKQSLAGRYYDQLMSPYEEKASDEVRDKVQRMLMFYVNKYTGGTRTANGDDGDLDWSDMDWSENKETDTPNGEGKGDEQKDTGYKNWFSNTMSDWHDAGIISNYSGKQAKTN